MKSRFKSWMILIGLDRTLPTLRSRSASRSSSPSIRNSRSIRLFGPGIGSHSKQLLLYLGSGRYTADGTCIAALVLILKKGIFLERSATAVDQIQ